MNHGIRTAAYIRAAVPGRPPIRCPGRQTVLYEKMVCLLWQAIFAALSAFSRFHPAGSFCSGVYGFTCGLDINWYKNVIEKVENMVSSYYSIYGDHRKPGGFPRMKSGQTGQVAGLRIVVRHRILLVPGRAIGGCGFAAES